MKKSIKRQIAMTFIGLVTAIMVLFVFVNNIFLEQYYVYKKQDKLIDVYEKMEKAVQNNGGSYHGIVKQLNEEVEVANIMFIIVKESKLVLEDNLIITTDEYQVEELKAQLDRYMFGQNKDDAELLESSQNYEIYKGEYIEMWGFLTDGSTFLIRTPIESIRESVMLSTRFALYITFVLVLLGSVFVWYFAKRIANPILELTELSEKMADLDFDAKYTSGGENEIGVLGANFNAMSEKLEQTISELKGANYELQKDIEKKEQIETMRTEFIGNVSHELKTPIALIQGYAEGLKEGISDDPESKEFYCDVIVDEAGKMNKMVRNLLTLNQLEYGQEEVMFERFNVIALIQGVVQSSEILIQQKEAKIKINAPEAVNVWADEWKVEQVFRNYLSNALNHLDGEHVIDIRVAVNDEKDTVRISVFNTGTPIPEGDIDQIWNKFYKVDKARTREYGGNGIGLSIVKAIMDSFHKGYGVKNYTNGVEFWFELDIK